MEVSIIKGLEIARWCVKTAEEKKAYNPVILKIKDLTDIADYFVICSGSSPRQIKAIASNIRDRLKGRGISVSHYESDTLYNWIVLDYISVIVHIFSNDMRSYYRLEQLWGDAKKID